MLWKSVSQNPQHGLFDSQVRRHPKLARLYTTYKIPFAVMFDRSLFMRFIEALHNANSVFLIRVVDWYEHDDHIMVYIDSIADTPLEKVCYETEFVGQGLPEQSLWIMVYSMLAAVHDAQHMRKMVLSDFTKARDPAPVLTLKAFYINDRGFCRLDALCYCFNYLIDGLKLLQIRHKTVPVLSESVGPADFLPYACAEPADAQPDAVFVSPHMSFYLEPNHKLCYPTETIEFLRWETYMVGRILLLLCDPFAVKTARSTSEVDGYYNADQLYFREYSIELALIGYRMLYTQGNIRFLVSDILEHDFFNVVKHLLLPAPQDCGKHLIGNVAMTPLMLAARSNFLAFADALVERYAGMQDICGKTALMYATESNSLHYIEKLKEKELRYQTRAVGAEDDGATALMFAVANGNVDAIELLKEEAGMRRCDGKTTLMLVCQHNEHIPDKVFGELIQSEKGMRDSTGYTALMYAAASGKKHDVQRLVPYEAGIQAESGSTALLLATSNGHAAICSMLIDLEGEKTDNEGCTALIVGSKLGLESVVRATLPLAGRVNNMGRTALMHALKYNRQRIVSILSQNECEMGVTDRYGSSALSMAAEKGDYQLLSIILSSPLAHKETGLRDKNGWTALIHAARNNHIDCVRALVKVQAGVKDLKGCSAIFYSTKWGYVDVTRELLEVEGHLLREDPGNSLLLQLEVCPEIKALINDGIKSVS